MSTLLLRLAGPLQAWGARSEFNRRETEALPTKSGVVGLLAAARGLRRDDELGDLLGLQFAVRADQPGTLLRDYHTVSDFRGVGLLSASVDAKGRQRRTSPVKYTQVTQRYYLQDATFVAAVGGPTELIDALAADVQRPAFPLALGRRSCPPARPLVIGTRQGAARDALAAVTWQASEHARSRLVREKGYRPATVTLAASADSDGGGDLVADEPVSFDPRNRSHGLRRVEHYWVTVSSGFADPQEPPSTADHDPFELLGW